MNDFSINHANALVTPTVGIDRTDVAQAVRESALLADVTISIWSAERSDKTLMDKLKSDAHAVGNVGRVIKNMLAGADGRLKDVKSAYEAVRLIHYKFTLPWVADPHAAKQTGPRLLPLKLFDDYMSALSDQKRKATALLETFLGEYPTLIEQARGNLGDLADATYPTADAVRGSFRIALDFNPIPLGKDFSGLDNHALERLSKNLQIKQKHMLAAAQADMWARVRDRVERLVGRLSDPEAKFHASTVENLRELIGVLPAFDIAGDPRVNEIVEDIGKMLDGVDAEKLRQDGSLRTDTARRGREVAEKLNSWGL